MLVLAHRGCHELHPENTLRAFDAAVAAGADGIETDVQTTRDGVPILFHDTAIRGQKVATLTHAELCHLSRREVPTLVNALDAWPKIFWNLEIKMPTNLTPIWPVLHEYRDKRRLLISSFWHPVAVQAGQELGLDYGLLVSHRPLSFLSLIFNLPSHSPTNRASIMWEHASVDAAMIAEAAGQGIHSFVWGLNSPEAHPEAAQWGAVGIITDHVSLGLTTKKIGY